MLACVQWEGAQGACVGNLLPAQPQDVPGPLPLRECG